MALGVHAGLSLLVAAAAAAAVFGLWYPEPFREISGGRELFLLVVAVDVVIGPLVTFAIFDRRKPMAELRRDLMVVVLLQLGALGYGLHTVWEARPAVLALEGGRRLRVVRTIDLDPSALARAPAGLRALPWRGYLLVTTRAPTAGESFEAIQLALQGVDVGMRPEFWRPPEETNEALRSAAQPVAALRSRYPKRANEFETRLAATGVPATRLGYLPLLARRTDWVALIDLGSGKVVGYAPFDGF